MKICLFISSLYAAGAERVLSILANEWTKKNWEVVIMIMDDPSSKPFYPLSDAIQLKKLDLMKDGGSFIQGLINNIKRIRAIRRAIREIQPDVVISFVDISNALTVMATRGMGIPIIVSERTDPSRRSLGFFWNRVRDFTYPRADLIVFQSQGVMDWFPPKVRARGVVIPNPVPVPPPQEMPRTDSAQRVVSLGRLDPVKGFDVLVKAFAATVARVPHWRLDIWGQGLERDSLEQMVRELGMADHIQFPGVTTRPFDVLRGADIFVLSSRAEGFPNALVEAMACGLPVISTQFGGAAQDIIQDGVDGLLVPPDDPDALARALVRLMSDPNERVCLAGRAPRIVERFSIERVLAMWEKAINQVIASKR